MLCSGMSKNRIDDLRDRRMEAGQLFGQGVKQAEVARQLKVSRQSVSRWYADWKKRGKKGLHGSERLGRPKKLSESELEQVRERLLKGPRANGLDADLWTLARMKKLIEQITGKRYTISGVWYILCHLGWSAQRPATRASQRNDQVVAAWLKQTWPAVKKTPDKTGP